MDGEIRYSGGKAFAVCADCNKLVTLNKFLLGSFHLCISPEERAAREYAIALQQQQSFANQNDAMWRRIGLLPR